MKFTICAIVSNGKLASSASRQIISWNEGELVVFACKTNSSLPQGLIRVQILSRFIEVHLERGGGNGSLTLLWLQLPL